MEPRPIVQIPVDEQYVYKPLPTSRSIRLLRIDSLPEEPLRCTLEIVILAENPEYDCLSYTWGDPLYQKFWPPEDRRVIDGYPRFDMQLNHYESPGDGKRIGIAENLYEALKQMCIKKQEGAASGDFGYERQERIWIDAVCINQRNRDEQKEQVDMMRDVYGQSKNVVVWLGPDDPQLDAAIEVLKILASIPKKKLDLNFPSSYTDSENFHYESLGIAPIPPWDWYAFAAFILRGWFSRIWVVQETWAASHIVVFVAGHRLSWASLTAAISVLRITNIDKWLNEETERINGPQDGARYIANTISNQFIFQEIIEQGKDLDLERLLAYSRYFNATMADDRVFAVRGMWTPGPKLEGKTDLQLIEKKSGMQSGETETIVYAYTTATLVAIYEQGDLNTISLVEDDSMRERKELPSWVPDYSVPPLMEPLQGIPRPNKGDERWNASSGLIWEPPKGQDGKLNYDTGGKLAVKGIFYDTIIEMADTEVNITERHSMHTLLQILQTALRSASTHDVREEFWRALIKDTFDGQEAGKDAFEAFPALFLGGLWQLTQAIEDNGTPFQELDADPDYLADHRGPLAELELTLEKTREVIDSLTAGDQCTLVYGWGKMNQYIEMDGALPEARAVNSNIDRITDSFQAAYIGRRLFRTRDNHIGIAAQSMCKDDEIWVLAGVAVPMILRRCGVGEWKLVGEAYVHGIMKGELVKERALESAVENLVLV